VQIWRDPVAPFTGSAQVAGLAIVQGGAAIASAGGGRTLFLWDRDGRLITAGTLPAVPAAIAASPEGKLLATASGDGTVAIRDLPGLAIRRQWHTGAPATDVAFSPDGRLLAAAAGATVTVWDTGSGARRLAFPVGRGAFEGIAFSPRGDALAAVTNRGNVMIWDTRTGRPAAQENAGPGALRAVAFSPAGTLLATAGNEGNITFWNPSGLHRLAVLASVGSVQALAFSPGGRVLASAEENGTILLWDTASRSVDATLTGSPPRSVQAVAFTGGTLFTGDKSGRIIAWDLDPDDMARRDCQVLARDPGLRQAETLVPQASYPRLCPAGAG
jgi:WD40 repeat protein